MGLNVQKLKGMQKDLAKKSGKGDSNLFLYANKLTEEDDVRILPPLPKMGDIYFVEQVIWWINKKTYQSKETFGAECVIQRVIDEAKESGDEDLLALINAKKEGMAVLKKETRYLVPILHLNAVYNDDDELETCEVKHGEARVLVAKPTLLTAMNKVVTGRHFQNGTENGVADREKGHNITLSKEGAGLDTTYDAVGWPQPYEMDEKWYDEKKIPDVMALVQNNDKDEDYLESVIRHYLYGEDIIEDKKASKSSKDAPKKTATKKTVEKMNKIAEKAGSGKHKRVASKTKKSLLDDANEYSTDDDVLNDLD